MLALRLKGLSKHFGVTVALSDVTLEVPSGQILGVLGPSGCGKTTLLRCVAGFERPTAGEIWLNEKLVGSVSHSLPPEKRDIGMVFQSYALWPHLTVADNVAMPLRLRGTAKADRPQLVAAVLERLGLTGLMKRYPSELSGGQQQRVALARATVVQPRVLLLDEPLSNLDSQLRHRLRDELREDLKKFGITTVFVTHDQAEAMVICDRVALLSSGSLIEDGAPRDLYERPGTLFTGTFLGRANVINATVVARKGDRATVAVSDSLKLDGVAKADLTVGAPAAVLIRPEHLSIDGAPGTTNQITGRVRHALFLGSRVDLLVDVGASVIRAELASAGYQDFAPGAAVTLSSAPERTLVFAR